MGDFDAACWHGCKWLDIYNGTEPCNDCNFDNNYKHYKYRHFEPAVITENDKRTNPKP